MKSYIKFLSRNKLYTAIEALGLAVSLAFVIIIACFSVQEYSIAHEHKDGGRIYTANMPDYPGVTYGFNDHLVVAIPEVEVSSRWCPNVEAILTCAGQSFSVNGAATDPQFFEIFPKYRFIEGSPEALKDRRNILISRTFAAQLPFNDPVGRSIESGGENFVIAGVVEDFSHSVFPYRDILVPSESPLNRDSWGAPYDHYGSTVPIMRLHEGTDRKAFTSKIDLLCEQIYPQFYGQSMFKYCRILRMDEIYFANLENFNGGDKSRLLLLAVIGLLLLLSAIFNYINLSFALTGIRAREMATRRLIGATKGMIFGKYIAESLLFTAICTMLAILLAIAITPMLNSLMTTNIRIAFTPGYLAIFLGLITVAGVTCGFVPAIAASRYEPIAVVRGATRTENKRIFSKIFIIFQGALAVFMISMAIVTEAQYSKSLSRPVHANITNSYFLRWWANLEHDKYNVLCDRLMQLPCVHRIGFAQGIPGTMVGGQFSTTTTGEEIRYRTYIMDSTAFAMLNFEKLKDFGAPVKGGVWFGQKAFNATGYTQENHEITELKWRMRGVGETAGVIADFPINASNMGAEDNLIVVVNDMKDMLFSGLLIETTESTPEAAESIRKIFDDWCMETYGTHINPMESAFVEDIFRNGLSESRRQMRLIEIFMAIAVLISLLGMLAMSTWYADRNSKDIAVRKVFGSTVSLETWSNVALYMKLVLISYIISMPVAIYAAGRYLQEYIYRIENYWWIFAIAVVLSGAASFLSVLWQTLKAARTNPAIELKKE